MSEVASRSTSWVERRRNAFATFGRQRNPRPFLFQPSLATQISDRSADHGPNRKETAGRIHVAPAEDAGHTSCRPHSAAILPGYAGSVRSDLSAGTTLLQQGAQRS